MVILAVDIGSSSVRAALFDQDAQAVPGATAARSHQFVLTPAGAATAGPQHLRALVEACIDQVLTHPRAAPIMAVMLAAFTSTLVGVDRAGEPLTPLYTYADLRGAHDAARLTDLIDAAAVHQRTGCPLHASYLPAKLHWLQRTEPELSSRVARWLDFGAYLCSHWLGRPLTSTSIASWSGLYDRHAQAWDAAWLKLLDLDVSRLPQIADYEQLVTGLTETYARRWPALADVPFGAAVGDGAAATIGSGGVDRGQIVLTLGTTAALRVLVPSTEAPPVPDGLWAYRVDRGHHLLGGATSEGGNVVRWARDTLRLPDDDVLETELAARQADQHGLTFLPLLAGERSPGFAPGASGAVGGLQLSTSALDLFHAALEGVALRLALIALPLAEAADPQAVVMAGGGALARSRAWAQIICDALNRPLQLVSEPEVTLRGAAILALCALGQGQLRDYPPAIADVLQPRPDHAAALAAALKRQQTLYERWVGPSVP